MVNSKHTLKYIEAIKKAKSKGMTPFQSWFRKSENLNHVIERGYWDFRTHILTPKVQEYLKNTKKKFALEIGYGGGRLLNASCAYFKTVIGIDIHNEKEMVSKFLKSQNKNNFKLIKTLGVTIDVESESIDFIYAFIVLNHLPSFDVFVNYIKETYRCLKKNGIAQLYFGGFNHKRQIYRCIQKKDGFLQLFLYPIKGYMIIPKAPVNHTSLVVNVSKVIKLSKDTGFKVLENGTSYERYTKKRKGQKYVTLLKI